MWRRNLELFVASGQGGQWSDLVEFQPIKFLLLDTERLPAARIPNGALLASLGYRDFRRRRRAGPDVILRPVGSEATEARLAWRKDGDHRLRHCTIDEGP